MENLKFTSNGITISNELTIIGNDNSSVNVKEKLDNLISDGTNIYNISIVSSLPSTVDSNTIYIIK